MEIKIKYINKDIPRLDGQSYGDWVDLSAAKTMVLKMGTHYLIPLGVAMVLPEGHEAHLAPRSSSYKNFGILVTNSVGVIDEAYCGENDWWFLSVLATRDTTIPQGSRVAQFRIMKKQPKLKFTEVEKTEMPDRGGHGSTGTN